MLQTWTARQAAQIIGVPYRTLMRWIEGGLVTLRLHRHPVPRERLRLVQEDVEEAWVVASLRKQRVPMRRIRRLMVWIDRVKLEVCDGVMCDGDAVVGVKRGYDLTPRGPVEYVSLLAIRALLSRNPGEVMSEAWERMLRADNVS